MPWVAPLQPTLDGPDAIATQRVMASLSKEMRRADTSIVNVSTGILNVVNGGTGVATLTGYVKGNGASAMTAQAVPIPVVDGGTGAITLTGYVKGAGTAALSTQAVPIPVADGGTGVITHTAANFLKGNGASAITSQAGVNVSDINAAAWTAWTPTYANLGAGTGGSQTARYVRIGNRIVFEVVIDYGTSAPAVAGQMSITLPTTPRGLFICCAYLSAASLGFTYDLMGRNGSTQIANLNTVYLYSKRLNVLATSTDLKLVATAGGAPITNPGTSDYLVVSGAYETA